MRSAIGTRENVRVLEDFTSGGIRVEILEYQKLMGLSDISMATQTYCM